MSEPSSLRVDPELAPLRAELDGIDEALFALVRDRMRCIERVGEIKARAGMPVFQPGRAAEVERQAATRAREHDLDEGFLVRLADLLMEEAIRIEEAIVAQAVASNSGASNPGPGELAADVGVGVGDPVADLRGERLGVVLRAVADLDARRRGPAPGVRRDRVDDVMPGDVRSAASTSRRDRRTTARSTVRSRGGRSRSCRSAGRRSSRP